MTRILFSIVARMFIVLLLTASSCSQRDAYEISGNMNRTFSVQPFRSGLAIYEGDKLVVQLDTMLTLKHIIEIDNQMYLVEEGPEVTAFYDIKGNYADGFVGRILYAEADTVLMTGTLRGYDDQRQVYSYLYLSKIGYGSTIDDLSCVEMIDVNGRSYVYTLSLDGDRRIYDMFLAPVPDVSPLPLSPCE